MKEVARNNRSAEQVKYKSTPRNSIFFFSLLSITCPAYKANETAGITSDKPSHPIASGSLVRLYIHHPQTVVIMRSAMTNKKRPTRRFLNSGMRTEATEA